MIPPSSSSPTRRGWRKWTGSTVPTSLSPHLRPSERKKWTVASVVLCCVLLALVQLGWGHYRLTMGTDNAETTILDRQERKHIDESNNVLDLPPLPTTTAPVAGGAAADAGDDKFDDDDNGLKFYILSIPETTTNLLSMVPDDDEINNNTTNRSVNYDASRYYQNALNEESAELWLHLGFQQKLYQHRTYDPNRADIFVVVGYLHLYRGLVLTSSMSSSSSPLSRRRRHHQPTGSNNNTNDNNIAGTHESQHNPIHEIVQKYKSMIVDATKPHLILIPTWNPKVSREVGIYTLMNMLHHTMGIQQIWSVGFERNPHWQGGNVIPVSRIIPIPYVLRMPPMATSISNSSAPTTTTTTIPQRRRQHNFVFYAGDRRRNAEGWAGCYRSKLILPLQQYQQQQQLLREGENGTMTDGSNSNNNIHIKGQTNDSFIDPNNDHHQNNNNNSINMDVRLVGKKDRLDQVTYNYRMESSEYCLIVCGDTPSSRSLTSAMVKGCIPIRIGSRLRGLCEQPCHNGFGWTVSGSQYPHLPYTETIPWNKFPELDEQAFMEDGYDVLQEQLFQRINNTQKTELYSIMDRVRPGWIYGYGDPVRVSRLLLQSSSSSPSSSHGSSAEQSNNGHTLGEATKYIWKSFVTALQEERKLTLTPDGGT